MMDRTLVCRLTTSPFAVSSDAAPCCVFVVSAVPGLVCLEFKVAVDLLPSSREL